MTSSFFLIVQDYEIQEKDILKIGRVKFAVKEIHYENKQQNKMDVEETKNEKGHSANSIFDEPDSELFEEFNEVENYILDQDGNDENENEDIMKCRFCWQAEATVANPLLTACRCQGTVGSIHLNCLKSWLEVKRQKKETDNFISFFWKSFECEICKKAYPLMLKAAEHKFDLV